jgi:WD40 repeat protein
LASRVDPYGDVLGNHVRARFGTHRFRCGGVVGVTLSDDDRLVACGSERGAVVYKASTGKELMRVGKGLVTAVALAPQGLGLAFANKKGAIAVYDLAEARRRRVMNHGSPVFAIRWTPDGTRLATAGVDRAILWNVDKEEAIWQIEGPISAISIARGHALAVAVADHVVVWDGSTRHDIPVAGVGAIGFAADGALVVVSAAGVERWSIRPVQRLPLANDAAPPLRSLSSTGLALSPTGGTMAVGTDDGEIHLVRTSDFQTNRRIEAHDGPVSQLAWSSGGSVLVSVSNGDVGPRLWAPVTGRRIVKGDGHDEAVRFVRSGGDLYVTGGDGVCVWDDVGRRIARLELEVKALDLSIAGDLLVVATPTEVLAFEGPGEGAVQRQLLDEGAAHVAISPDGKHVFVSGERHVLLSSEDGRVLWSEEATGAATSVRFVGEALVAACNGNEVRRWLLDRGFVDAVEMSFPVAGCVDLSPDGTQLVGMDGVWDVDDGSRLSTQSIDGAQALAFSPDNRHLAVAQGALIFVHDLKTGGEVRLRAHEAAVRSLHWADSGQLCSGSVDCTALAWDVASALK